MSTIYENRGRNNVTERDAILELGVSFVRTMEHIKNIAETIGCFLLIHGTQMHNCVDVLNDARGLKHYENDYTSTASTFSSYSNLYNTGLINGMLPEGFIILLIPKTCFRGYGQSGLWHSLVLNDETGECELDDDADIEKIDSYSIPLEYIFGFIDLENKRIIQNKKFDAKYRNGKLILDAHTLGSVLSIRENELISKEEGRSYKGR